MDLARDDSAASPLVVLTTFVVVAVLVTIIVYALAFDRPEDGVSLVAVHQESGALSFDVTATSGGLGWDEVTLRLLDRAGSDLGPSYLHLPNGTVDPEDRVDVVPLPPAGTYLLMVFKGDHELSRLSVTV
ncbi:MAG TPA: hypothetical protein VM327_02065 [Candidatus Thermoplasmatota archaeon]|nr:hypothetical protein [Candidatus Thermoplasmatota archaeon]